MAGTTRPDILTDVEYERMLALLTGYAKGRIFLAEFAAQARAEDTCALFAALTAIQSSLAVVREQLRPEALAAELGRIAVALERPAAEGEEHLAAAVARARADLAGLAEALARGAAPVGHSHTGEPGLPAANAAGS